LQSVIQAIGSGFTLVHVLFDVVDTIKKIGLNACLKTIISQIVVIGKCFNCLERFPIYLPSRPT